MNVVSYSEAARRAGVSRQAINDLKRVNKDNKGKYPFFIFDPITGKPGIDIENRHWLDYLGRNKVKRVRMNQEKSQKKDNKKAVMSSESDNSARIQSFIKSCFTAAQEVFHPSAQDMNRFKQIVIEKYKES